MRKIICFISFFITTGASAEPYLSYSSENLTLNGLIIIDGGYTYADDIAGDSETDFQSGMQSPNLIGIGGSYMYGENYGVVFKLQNQFGLEDGKTIGDGLFSREAWLGVQAPYGTITAGKQYEFMFESLAQKRWGRNLPMVSLHQMQQGPFDNLLIPGGYPPGVPTVLHLDFNRVSGAFRVEDSLKYTTPEINGFSAGVLYGGDGVDYAGEGGDRTDSETFSSGVNYGAGPVKFAAAYTRSNNFLGLGSDIANIGAGLAYDIGAHTLDFMYTKTENRTLGGEIDVYALGSFVSLGDKLSGYLNYQLMDGNDALLNRKAHQIGATLLYHASQHVDLYGTVVYQDTDGDDETNARIAAVSAASGDESQSIARVGVRLTLF
ncbi:porin [Marinobacter zhejiangensis]|uniref:Outer membrane protein (Porin) n=1 Tax=Marinobacter zhejiangensis TaxID=488535 RepID=A0A1I4PGI1_9GAMM|nr:porin [Marinobacter zhejiangensis]SFM26828.1 Outer membrane protein (porin) [Marinobacter zhejiangensis]